MSVVSKVKLPADVYRCKDTCVFCNPDVGNFVKIDPTFSYVQARNETNFKIRENSIAGNKFYKFVSLFNLENKRGQVVSQWFQTDEILLGLKKICFHNVKKKS